MKKSLMPIVHYSCCLLLLALMGCERAVVNAPLLRIVFEVAPDDPKELTAHTGETGFMAISVIGNLGDQQINPETIAWIEKDSQNSRLNFAMSIGTLSPNDFWVVYVYANIDLELATKPEQLKAAQQKPVDHRLPPGAYGLRIGRDETNRLQILEILNAKGEIIPNNVFGMASQP